MLDFVQKAIMQESFSPVLNYLLQDIENVHVLKRKLDKTMKKYPSKTF